MDHKKDDKDKISKLDKIKLLISVLSLLFSGTVMLKLFSVENSYNKQLQILQQDFNTQLEMVRNDVETNIQDVKATIVSSNVENTTNNYGAVIDERDSVTTLLKYAENAYLAGDYETVIQIYSMEKLAQNDIACSNLGFMFANGLYYDVELSKADEYYRKAIKYGNLKAYDNMLAAHFRLWEDDCIEILLLGYAGEYPDAKMMEFIASHYEGYEDFTTEDKIRIVKKLLFETPEEEQTEIIDGFYSAEFAGTVSLTYTPTDTAIERYVYTGEIPYITKDEAGTTKQYEKYMMYCSEINILDEGWCWVE